MTEQRHGYPAIGKIPGEGKICVSSSIIAEKSMQAEGTIESAAAGVTKAGYIDSQHRVSKPELWLLHESSGLKMILAQVL